MLPSWLRHDFIFNVHASEGRNRSHRRYGSTIAIASELPPAVFGRKSKGPYFKHPMSPGDLEHLRVADRVDPSPPEKASPIIPPDFYGKWRFLSLNNDLLRTESEVNAPQADRRLLVDQPGNENDIVLWTILLRFRCQRMGLEGASMIWEGVNKRRTLHEVHGIIADAFWQTTLNNALQDNDFLESVWLYALWLDETHGVKIPKLYTTVIAFFLRQQRGRDALLWHFRLSPTFDPGRAAFVRLIRAFITDPDDEIRDTLKHLYLAGSHRDLYDELVPYLYNLGKAALARNWRGFCVLFNDVPVTMASREFLRYLAAYHSYPDNPMKESEISIAGLSTESKPTLDIAEHLDDMEEQPGSGMDARYPLSYLINRIHGETFGVQEKTLNDVVGARWFASSWISLDLAITAVHALGISSIGPLSLQSIALREESAAGILRRITQLQSFKIGIGTSNYSKAIRYLARNGDYETLRDLLQSDFHPDVFESKEMQATIFQSCMLSGDWKKYHLIGIVNLAASVDSAFLFSNELLLASIVDGNKQMTLQILNDMRSRNIDIFPSTSHKLSMCIGQRIGLHKGHRDTDVDYLIALSRQLARTPFPPPARVWERLLWHLGRNDKIDELEYLALEVTQLYTSWQSSPSPTMNLPVYDVPEAMKDGSPYEYFKPVPRELHIRHEAHPLQAVFHSMMQKSIVRLAFNYELRHGAANARIKGKLSRLSDFYIARGVRLLRLLRDQGVRVDPKAIKKAVLLRLTDLYGPTTGSTRSLEHSKYANRMTMPEVKQLFDDAWGEDFLGSLGEIEHFLIQEGNRRFEAERKYNATRSRSRQASPL